MLNNWALIGRPVMATWSPADEEGAVHDRASHCRPAGARGGCHRGRLDAPTRDLAASVLLMEEAVRRHAGERCTSPQDPRRGDSATEAPRRQPSAESANTEERLGKWAQTTGEPLAVITAVQGRLDVSERNACQCMGLERTAVRYVPRRQAWDASLRARHRELTAAYPRWGVPPCIDASSSKGLR